MKRKNICICLILSMLLSCLAGCGGEEAPDTTAETVETEAVPTEATETELSDDLPEKDYEGATFTILTAAEQWQRYYNSEATGDVIQDAVHARNLAVEERFNVDLDYQIFNGYTAGMDSVKAALMGSVMAGSMDYDLFVGTIIYVLPRIADGLFTDLNTLEYINLDQPWWYPYVNDTLEICNKQYLASGSFGLTSLGFSVVTFFNKEILIQNNLEDLYTLVNEGKWTFDKYNTMAQTVTYDTDGNNTYDKNDRFGLVSTPDYLVHLSISFGYKHISKDEDGKPVLNGATERIVDINDLLYNLTQSNSYFYAKDESGTTQYSGMLSIFSNNQALFLTHRLNHVEDAILREMENYGIVPNCKYDESQKDYITSCIAEVSAVPAVVKDFEMSSIVLEALQFASYVHVIPAYYDIALQRKMTRDEESSKMLDIIISNFDCDLAQMAVKVIGGELFENTGFTENYVSWMEKDQKSLQTKLDKFTEQIAEDNT